MNHEAFAHKMHSYTILYVEDDDEIRHYISSFLERYCKTVFACNSAENGLVLYEEKHPDIIILDINLGMMSGVEMKLSKWKKCLNFQLNNENFSTQ